MPLTRVGRWTVIYGLVAVELAAFGGVYYIWNGLNRSQDYRRWMYHHHPRILETFYWSCTVAGVHDAKERDLLAWDIPNRKR